MLLLMNLMILLLMLLSRIITTILREINKDDFDTIDQLAQKVAQIMKQPVNTSKD